VPGDYLRLAIEETPRYEGVQELAPYRVSTVPIYMPIQTARIAPGAQFEDRSDEARNIEGGVPQIVETFEPEGALALRAYINSMTFLLQLCGYQGTVTTGAGGGTDEVQTLTITGTPTGGTYTLTWISPEGVSETTAPIPYNATASQVDAALEALRNIPAGALTCAGGPHPGTPITVTFAAMGLEKRNVNQMTADSSLLTGGTTPTVTPTTTTPGVAGAVSDPDGRTLPAGTSKWVFAKRGGTTAKTAQLIAAYADELVHLRGSGYGVSQLSVNAEGAVTAELMGLVLENIADPGFTPSFDVSSIRHAMRADLFLTWLAGGGVAGDFSLQIANPLRRVWTLGLAPSSKFANEMLHGDERVRITGAIPKEILDDDDVNALMAGTTFTAKARWQTVDSTIAASGYPYSMWCEMPKAQYIGFAPDDVANRRRFGGNFDFWAAWDESLGYDARFTVVGNVPAMETYV